MSIMLKVDTDSTNNVAKTVGIRMDAIDSVDVVDGYLVVKFTDYYKAAYYKAASAKR